MIIAQVCFRLATIKGHSKMYSFTVLGGGGGVRKPVSILVWSSFASRNATHLLHIELIRLLIVFCVMLVHSSSMAVWSCWILAGTEHAVVYTDPEHHKHAQWVTCLVSMQAMQELGWFQLPGIVYRCLQHGAVHYHATTWGDGRGWMAQQWASESHHGISVKKTPLQSARCHRMWAFAHSSWLR